MNRSLLRGLLRLQAWQWLQLVCRSSRKGSSSVSIADRISRRSVLVLSSLGFRRACFPFYQCCERDPRGNQRDKQKQILPDFPLAGPSPFVCEVQASFEDLRALAGGSRPPILRLHSDRAKEFLTPVIRTDLSQQKVRQTVNSGYDPAGNGLAERWLGIIKVRAMALLADVRLPPEYWPYACRWVAYVHTHRVTKMAINKSLPHFGDVVVVHQALKKPPSL